MQDAEAQAWKAYADASCMHDAERARAACADLACLVPSQREKLVRMDLCTKPNHVIQ